MCNSTISRPLYTDEDHPTQRGMLKSVPMDEVIQVDGLVKRFGNLTAVDGVSFTVNRGEIFGIVGPNGAGKTTTLEIIEGLQRATTGQVRVLGMDINSTPVAIKERIGVQLQASAYFDYLTLVEILDLFGSFYSTHIPPMELLEMVDLQDKANTVLKKLSGGQKQRFTVAASLVNDPELIILDEPSTGLDPAARHSLWDLIRRVHSQGKTLVLTTHYMEEAQTLCHRVAIMDRGKILALDSIPKLIQSLDAAYRVILTTSKPLDLPREEPPLWEVEGPADGDNASLRLRVKDPPKVLSKIMDQAARQGITIEDLQVVPATLEDVFLELTGHGMLD